MSNNIRISLKIDQLSNWNNSKLILNSGELALIQLPNDTVKIKIGNGTDVVSALPYLNETEFCTDILQANQLNIGQLNVASQNSFVAGAHLSSIANNSTAIGFNAQVPQGDNQAFVWNGKNLYGYNNKYTSHGPGTFSINPENGISGIYIGEENLSDMVTNLTRYKLVNAEYIGNKPDIVYNVEDNTITTINLDDSQLNVTINLPAKRHDNYARNFIIRLNVTQLPKTIIWNGLDDDWLAETADETWQTLVLGVNTLKFIEVSN